MVFFAVRTSPSITISSFIFFAELVPIHMVALLQEYIDEISLVRHQNLGYITRL